MCRQDKIYGAETVSRAHTPAGSQEVSVRQRSIRGGTNTPELGWVCRSEGAEILRSTCQSIRQGFRKWWGSAIVWDMLQGSVLACPTVQKPLLESVLKSHLLSLLRKEPQKKYGKISAIEYWLKFAAIQSEPLRSWQASGKEYAVLSSWTRTDQEAKFCCLFTYNARTECRPASMRAQKWNELSSSPFLQDGFDWCM